MNLFHIFLVFIGVALRFIPHPPNFAPIGAMALFSGRYIKNKWLAISLPLLAMLVSDYFIGFASIPITASVYLSFGLMVLLGRWLRSHHTLPNVVGASLLGSTLFFLITNGVVWAFDIWGMYPDDFSGLLASYIAGLPFYKYTLAGDLFYVGIFFGVAALANYLVSLKKRRTSQSLVGYRKPS